MAETHSLPSAVTRHTMILLSLGLAFLSLTGAPVEAQGYPARAQHPPQQYQPQQPYHHQPPPQYPPAHYPPPTLTPYQPQPAYQQPPPHLQPHQPHAGYGPAPHTYAPTKKPTYDAACCLPHYPANHYGHPKPIYNQLLFNQCPLVKSPEAICQAAAELLYVKSPSVLQYSEMESPTDVTFVYGETQISHPADIVVVSSGCCFNIYGDVKPGQTVSADCENSILGTEQALLESVFKTSVMVAGHADIKGDYARSVVVGGNWLNGSPATISESSYGGPYPSAGFVLGGSVSVDTGTITVERGASLVGGDDRDRVEAFPMEILEDPVKAVKKISKQICAVSHNIAALPANSDTVFMVEAGGATQASVDSALDAEPKPLAGEALPVAGEALPVTPDPTITPTPDATASEAAPPTTTPKPSEVPTTAELPPAPSDATVPQPGAVLRRELQGHSGDSSSQCAVGGTCGDGSEVVGGHPSRRLAPAVVDQVLVILFSCSSAFEVCVFDLQASDLNLATGITFNLNQVQTVKINVRGTLVNTARLESITPATNPVVWNFIDAVAVFLDLSNASATTLWPGSVLCPHCTDLELNGVGLQGTIGMANPNSTLTVNQASTIEFTSTDIPSCPPAVPEVVFCHCLCPSPYVGPTYAPHAPQTGHGHTQQAATPHH